MAARWLGHFGPSREPLRRLPGRIPKNLNFACDKCQRRYTLPDEKVRGKIVKVRCKNCQFLISVGPLEEGSAASAPAAAVAASSASARGTGASPWDDEPTRAAPTLDRSVPWFAMVRGAQVGPFDFASLQQQITHNELSLRTYLWREGMPDWKRAQDLPELAPLFSAASTGPHPVVKGPPPSPAPQRFPAGAEEPEEVTRAVSRSEMLAQAQEAERLAESAPRPGVSSEREAAPAAQPVASPATRKTAPARASLDLGGELFSDLDLHHGGPAPHADSPPAEQAPAPKPRAKKKKVEEEATSADPFAQLAELPADQLPEANESTSFFIAQAGVHKRNPPWKIAGFVLLIIGVPLGLLYALSAMKVIPLEVTREDAEGHEVKAPVFSAEGLSGLGRTLLGTNKKPVPSVKPAGPVHIKRALPAGQMAAGDHPSGDHATSAVGSVAGVDSSDLVRGRKGQNVSPDLKALYEDSGGKKDVGPNVHKAAVVADNSGGAGGPPEEAVAKVVGQTQAAFQFCIEQQLKKNPGFRGGKVSLIATVGSSGTVKKASLSKPDIEMSDLGLCLRTKAKRMAFPAFQGDDVDLDIPLILTTTL